MYSSNTLSFRLRSYHWWFCLSVPWMAVDQLAGLDLQRSFNGFDVVGQGDICTCPSPTANQEKA